MKLLLKSSNEELRNIFRARTPEGIDHNFENTDVPDESGDSVDDASDAEAQAKSATEHGDAAVDQALLRAKGIQAEHNGSLGGTKTYTTSAGYNIEMASDGGAEEARAMAEAVKMQKQDVAAANEELQQALAETPKIESPEDDAIPDNLQTELGDIDETTQTAEAEVTAETNQQMASVGAEAQNWFSDVAPDTVMTAG